MNGAVYISFFQGQLESVLEQVVQLAVQEISKTVGSSLNSLLLETAVKEQENRRLQLQLQSRESRSRANGGGADGGGSAAPGKNKVGERADSGRTKPEQQLQLHATGGQGTEPGVLTDTRRLEQRGRVVDQLKSVMKQVLDFAVCELTKIVEASFDDLLLEITKMEREQQVLEERLDKSSENGGGGEKGRGGGGGGEKGRGGGGGGEKGRGGGGEKGRGGGGAAGGRRRGSENDSVSPSGSEDTREELTEVTVSKKTPETDDPDRPPVLSVSQDWVPILDKVFGQKWCSDVWQIKELGGGGCSGGRGLSEGGVQQVHAIHAPSVTLEPAPSSPQQDPRWTPLEDMEVFSPDDEDGHKNAEGGARPSPGPPHSPTGSSGRRSSASMLHRLLTLPSQLLEDDNESAATDKETLVALAIDTADERRDNVEPAGQTSLSPLTTREEEEDYEEEEEGEEEEKGRKKKRRRIWSECEECGRRFSRVLLLKAHRQTHAAADTASPSSPPSSASALCCSECGKRFSSVTRLHSHIQTQHPAGQS